MIILLSSLFGMTRVFTFFHYINIKAGKKSPVRVKTV